MRPLTVRELIIETDLQVQRLAGNRRDKIKDDITIWRLNTAQDRFVKKHIKPDPSNPGRYLVDQKSNSDIQVLKRPNLSLPSFKDTDNRSFGYLPYDFAYLLNDRSKVIESCNTNFTTSLLGEASYYYSRIPFPDTTKLVAPYYTQFRVRKNADSLYVETAGVPSKKQKFEFIDAVIAAFKYLGVAVYWEKFDDSFWQNNFIAVPPFPINGDGSVNPVSTLSIEIDGVAVPGSTGNPRGPHNDGLWRRYKTFAGLRESPNRMFKDDFMYDAMNFNYYDRPEIDSPVSQLMDNKIYAFSDKRFLVSEIIIDYIRKPRPISLPLNQTCELDGSTHEEICSLAAEMILGNVEAPNYPLKVQENLTRKE